MFETLFKCDTEFSVAIRSSAGGYGVSTYGTFTQDLDSVVSYLKGNSITTVAIESTGVYYVPLYLKLEEAFNWLPLKTKK